MAAEGGHEDIVNYLASKESGVQIHIDDKDKNGVSMKDCVTEGKLVVLMWVLVSLVPRHLGKAFMSTVPA